MSTGKWLNNIGRIIKKKDGGFFMVFERRQDKNKQYIGDNPFPMVINEGDFFQLKPKKEDLANLVLTGKLTQELSDKICETVRFEINKAPAKDESGQVTKTAKPNDGGVNF